MELKLKSTKLKGCYQLFPKLVSDERGFFVKNFQKDFFNRIGLPFEIQEEYYSYSKKNVLRGLHFQLPPQDHCKIVQCLLGEVLDVVVDLRVGSPTFGEYEMFNLNEKDKNIIYIPKGLAHGFYVTGDHALLYYQVTTKYSKLHDSGIHWSSVNIPWPNHSPITSKRDENMLAFADFKSPFRFKEGEVLD